MSLDIIDGEASDHDPEVIAGMSSRALLPAAEDQVSDLPS